MAQGSEEAGGQDGRGRPEAAPRAHHRPQQRVGAFFEEFVGGPDPALITEAADRAAALLVRGARVSGDEDVANRLLHLAETEGIETIAEAWAGSPADSLAGCLWRLYLLRSWVYAEPVAATAQFEAGLGRATVARVVAGVAEPPGPDALREMLDAVLRGIAGGDFADVLFRAAAFSRIVATGRATLPDLASARASRMLALAEQLEAAGHLELTGRLG